MPRIEVEPGLLSSAGGRQQELSAQIMTRNPRMGARMPRPLPILNAAALLFATGLAAGCGSPDDTPGSFAQSKRQLAEIVKRTAVAALPDLKGNPSSEPPVPYRTACGVGPASGEYAPGYGLDFKLPDDADLRRIVERVARHWRQEGYGQREDGGSGRRSADRLCHSGRRPSRLLGRRQIRHG